MKKSKIVFILLAIFLAGCGSGGTNAPEPSASPSASIETPKPVDTPTAQESTVSPTPDITVSPSPAATQEPQEIEIVAVGDIISHEPMIAAAYDKKSKTYDFNYQFQYIKDILGSADLALGNFECTLGGSKKPYSKNKYFNAPDTIADALKGAGFDLLSTINNHAYDTGSDGMHRTLDVLRGAGFQTVGTRKDAAEPAYLIVDVKGVKVGVAAYAYEKTAGGGVDLNGRPVKAADIGLVSVFYPNNAADLEKMQQTAKDMRAAGAEIVVFFVHWGVEYQRAPNAQQRAMAKGLADAGVDVVFGSHPHVLQPIEAIDSAVTGKRTYVVYSMGNFIANMREEYKGTHSYKYTEDGMIVSVKVKKDAATGQAAVSSISYLPTWTFLYSSGGRKFTVLPLPQALADPGAFGITSKRDKNKAQTSYNQTTQLMKDAVAQGWLQPDRVGYGQ